MPTCTPAASATSATCSRQAARSPLSGSRPPSPRRRRGASATTAATPSSSAASLPPAKPSLAYERELLLDGARRIAGVDEVGRGALAGPVAAAAVVLPDRPQPWFDRVNDSKLLSPAVREELAELIVIVSSVGFAMVAPGRIDSHGILAATREAMTQAVRALGAGVDALLIDALTLPEAPVARQRALVHGDRLSLSIACASIVAKVARDRLMDDLDAQHPGYGLSRNKGYATQEHRDAVARLGPSPIHRVSFLSRQLPETEGF